MMFEKLLTLVLLLSISLAQQLFSCECTQIQLLSLQKGTTGIVPDPFRPALFALQLSNQQNAPLSSDLQTLAISYNPSNNVDKKLNFGILLDYLGLGGTIDFSTEGVVQAGTLNKYFDISLPNSNQLTPFWQINPFPTMKKKQWTWFSDMNDVYFGCFSINNVLSSSFQRLLIVFYGWGNSRIEVYADQGSGLQLQDFWLQSMPSYAQDVYNEYSVTLDIENDIVYFSASPTDFKALYVLPAGFFSSMAGPTQYCTLGMYKGVSPPLKVKYLYINGMPDFGLQVDLNFVNDPTQKISLFQLDGFRPEKQNSSTDLSSISQTKNKPEWQRLLLSFSSAQIPLLSAGSETQFKLSIYDYKNATIHPYNLVSDFLFANLLVVQCHVSCKTCISPSDTGCQSCEDDSEHRIFDATLGKCLCQPGFYEEAGRAKCLPCHVSCYRCKGPAENQCLACDSQAFRYDHSLQDGTCPCADGYVEEYDKPAKKCRQDCFYTCDTCDGSAYDQCTMCRKFRGGVVTGIDGKLINNNNNKIQFFHPIRQTCDCKDDFQEKEVGKGNCSELTTEKPAYFLARTAGVVLIMMLVVAFFVAIVSGKTLHYFNALDQLQQLSLLFYINVHFPSNFAKVFAVLDYCNFFVYCMPNFPYIAARAADLLQEHDAGSSSQHSKFHTLVDQNSFTKFQLNGRTNCFLTNCGGLIEFTVLCWMLSLLLDHLVARSRKINQQQQQSKQQQQSIRGQMLLQPSNYNQNNISNGNPNNFQNQTTSANGQSQNNNNSNSKTQQPPLRQEDEEEVQEEEEEKRSLEASDWVFRLRAAFWLWLPISVLRTTSGDAVLGVTLQLHGGVSFVNGLNAISNFFLMLFVYYAAIFLARLHSIAAETLPFAFCHDKQRVRPYLRALFAHVSMDQHNFHAQHWFQAQVLKKALISFFTVVAYRSAMAQSVMLLITQTFFTVYVALYCPYRIRKYRRLYTLQEFMQLFVYVTLIVFVAGQGNRLPYDFGSEFLIGAVFCIIIYQFLFQMHLACKEWHTLEQAFNKCQKRDNIKNGRGQVNNNERVRVSPEGYVINEKTVAMTTTTNKQVSKIQ